MRVLLVVVLGFGLPLLAQSPRERKILEIDNRIAELQKEIDGLEALKAVVSSGQLPDSALNQITVGSPAGEDQRPAAKGIVGPTGERFHIAAPAKKLYFFPAKR